MTVKTTNTLAKRARPRVGGLSLPSVSGIDPVYSESVSIRSARPKSSSVRPPLLCVERINRTLL
jgi:hypothetical protein